MSGRTSRAQRNVPTRLTSSIRRRSESAVFCSGAEVTIPALLTSTAMGPRPSRTAAKHSCTAVSREHVEENLGCPPAERMASTVAFSLA